jgi:hypothetical protein
MQHYVPTIIDYQVQYTNEDLPHHHPYYHQYQHQHHFTQKHHHNQQQQQQQQQTTHFYQLGHYQPMTYNFYTFPSHIRGHNSNEPNEQTNSSITNEEQMTNQSDEYQNNQI